MATLQDFLQSMSNSAASNVSAPVDGINWLMRKAGLPASDAPFMGSDWMEQKGLTRPVQLGAASVLGETAGMLAPFAVAAKAPQIAKGLLGMGDNLAAPQVLRKESGMFIGPSAKTWDAEAASKAQMLAAKGVDPRAVWSETGTWKGPDGHWRQEIPDNMASIKNDLLPTVEIRGKSYPDFKVQDALEHQGLFEAYPSVKGIQQSISNDGKFGGTYRDGSDWISLDQRYQVSVPSEAQQKLRDAASNAQTEFYNNPRVKRYDGLLNTIADKHGFGDRMEKTINKFGGEIERQRVNLGKATANAIESTSVNPIGLRLSPTAKSTQLHELQHAIQQREGFASGGSPDSMQPLVNDYNQTKQKFDQALRQSLDSSDPIAAANAAQERQFYGLKLGEMSSIKGADSNELYRRLAGEAEARATQARIPLDAAQRRATFPLDSYDVPVDQLIIRGLLK
jgi:hypothetical protein